MRRSPQAFSAPSKQTQSSNAKDELSSTASINASSTTLIPSSELLASKPRDCTLKREQNSCYEHDNGLRPAARVPVSSGIHPHVRPKHRYFGVRIEELAAQTGASDARPVRSRPWPSGGHSRRDKRMGIVSAG